MYQICSDFSKFWKVELCWNYNSKEPAQTTHNQTSDAWINQWFSVRGWHRDDLPALQVPSLSRVTCQYSSLLKQNFWKLY